jgi:peptide/nickel transport system ATP-binding protein
MSEVLIDVKDLKIHFFTDEGIVWAVDGVDLSLKRGTTLELVGESGCGKTTVGRCIVRAYKPTAGEIMYQQANGSAVDLAGLKGGELQPYRKDIRMIFQDPYSSLNPRMTVFELISEVLKVNHLGAAAEIQDKVEILLQRVGMRPEYMQRYPHAFSGGERQRICIARALITNPRLVVCDEAVSGLDVSIRAQILNLLEELQADFDLTYLFIPHDLSVIRHLCDRIVVMYVGKVVEIADGIELYTNPRHPYTEALMSAVPVTNPAARKKGARIRLEGDIADPSNPPSGCYFHPRCRFAQERCRVEAPALQDTGDHHFTACHFAGQLSLAGVRMAN